MPKRNKGKPSGKFAESKRDIGRKGDYKRSGWPEDATLQHATAPGRLDAGKHEGGERNRKAGSSVESPSSGRLGGRKATSPTGGGKATRYRRKVREESDVTATRNVPQRSGKSRARIELTGRTRHGASGGRTIGPSDGNVERRTLNLRHGAAAGATAGGRVPSRGAYNMNRSNVKHKPEARRTRWAKKQLRRGAR
jgi:hypothetical protein